MADGELIHREPVFDNLDEVGDHTRTTIQHLVVEANRERHRPAILHIKVPPWYGLMLPMPMWRQRRRMQRLVPKVLRARYGRVRGIFQFGEAGNTMWMGSKTCRAMTLHCLLNPTVRR